MIRFQLHGGEIGSSLSGPALVAEFGPRPGLSRISK